MSKGQQGPRQRKARPGNVRRAPAKKGRALRERNPDKEVFMKKSTKDQQQAPPQTRPVPSQEAEHQREKMETKEVAGRHKNDGQKDHKGAR
jgi:hypothetical protein